MKPPRVVFFEVCLVLNAVFFKSNLISKNHNESRTVPKEKRILDMLRVWELNLQFIRFKITFICKWLVPNSLRTIRLNCNWMSLVE